MKKVANLLFLLLMVVVSAGMASAEEGTKAGLSPFLKQIDPKQTSFEVSMNATRYPNFKLDTEDNQACDSYVETAYTGGCDTAVGTAQGGMSNAYLWCKSAQGASGGAGPLSQAIGFIPINGMKMEIEIPERYRDLSDILVTWMLRVEAEAQALSGGARDRIEKNLYIIWPHLCRNWHGTVVESFEGGNIYSKAFVNGKQSDEVVMFIPYHGSGAVGERHDPTHTGSFFLKRSEFGNSLPAKIVVEVYWKNDSALKVFSVPGRRNLTVSVIPSIE